MIELVEEIAQLSNQWSLPPEQFRSLMYYIVDWGNTFDTAKFLYNIAAGATDYQENVMTIAEQLRQERPPRGGKKRRDQDC